MEPLFPGHLFTKFPSRDAESSDMLRRAQAVEEAART